MEEYKWHNRKGSAKVPPGIRCHAPTVRKKGRCNDAISDENIACCIELHKLIPLYLLWPQTEKHKQTEKYKYSFK